MGPQRRSWHPGASNLSPNEVGIAGAKPVRYLDMVKAMLAYIWPKHNVPFRIRVIVALGLLVGAKVSSTDGCVVRNLSKIPNCYCSVTLLKLTYHYGYSSNSKTITDYRNKSTNIIGYINSSTFTVSILFKKYYRRQQQFLKILENISTFVKFLLNVSTVLKIL